MQHLYDKIISFIRTNGPSLPIQVAKVIEKDTFYAGAVLSDLLAKKIIKITAAKIGGSPLYYLPEQQAQLSRLYDHLPLREKEAYDLLKEKKVLKDADLQPAIRVACQMLRDFAVPREVEGAKYWQWHLASSEEARQVLMPSPKQEGHVPQQLEQVKLPLQQPRKKQRSQQQDDFAGVVKSFLSDSKIIISERISQRKNKELILTVKIPSSIGSLDMLVIAKNKKKITANDLALAHQKGQAKKMPALFLATGDIAKKAEQHVEKNLKGYLILRKV